MTTEIDWSKSPEDALTFGELSRVEQIALFEHVLDGGRVEVYGLNDCWDYSSVPVGAVYFASVKKYRKVATEMQIAQAERDVLYEQLDKLESQIDKANDRIVELKGG